jgi:ABC-type uncharacterized transport system permease subunit
MPDTGQLILLAIAIAFFVVAGVIASARLHRDRPHARIAAKACTYFGIATGLAVLAWHVMTERATWLPLDDNFEALVWLALLLAGFVQYVQRTRPIGGLDSFLMPIVVLLLVAAAVFGRATPHEYVPHAWWWVHRVTAYGGAVAFAVACAVGAMYLVHNRRLRDKVAIPGPNLGSLERLEHLTMTAVTLGFALLTVGAITGLILMLAEHRDTPLPKLVLTAGVWLAYALVLHAPMNPRFRGRKSAILSIVGFALMIGTIVTVQLMPTTAR